MNDKAIPLAGNPNSGKTTLFNKLTGQHRHVGNWPGVTVERVDGQLRASPQIVLTDLPGLYSMTPFTPEENVASDFLLAGRGMVLNVADARSLSRSLYLTLLLMELGRGVTLALTMLDRTQGVDCRALSSELGIPVIAVNARTGEGIGELSGALANPAAAPPKPLLYPNAPLESAVSKITPIIRRAAPGICCARFLAMRTVEGFFPDMLDGAELERVISIKKALESDCGADGATICASARYKKIDGILHKASCSRTCYQAAKAQNAASAVTPSALTQTGKKARNAPKAGKGGADALLLNRLLAYPIFAGVMCALFWLCFGAVGMTGRSYMEAAISWTRVALSRLLEAVNAAPALRGLALDGILSGVGGVLSFLPQLALLFFGMSLLEECGYLARAAFIMDRPLRRFGLTGKAFVPLLMGFGCTVSSVMAARTLENGNERKRACMLAPFFSCGAKLPVYSLVASSLFPNCETLAIAALYIAGMACALVYSRLCAGKGGETPELLLELPQCRMPSLSGAISSAAEKCGGFLRRAGAPIFMLSVLLWCMQHFTITLRYLPNGGAQSVFSAVGEAAAPLFAPLGFGFCAVAVALIAGVAAKEAIVAALYVSCAPSTPMAALAMMLTPLSAASLLVFCLLYTPCVSALAAMSRELGGWRGAAAAALRQTAFAYAAALAVYQVGMLLLRIL